MRGRVRATKRWTWALALCALALALVSGRGAIAQDSSTVNAGAVGRCYRELADAKSRVAAAEGRAMRETSARKRLEHEVARLEEALEEARRRTDYAHMATTMAKEAGERAKKLATEAKPILKRAVKEAKPMMERAARAAKPMVQRAGKRARTTYENEIRRMKKVWSPLRRRVKTKMRQHDGLRRYATDDNIEFAFQAAYTLFLAWAVMRVMGVINHVAFGRRARPAQRVPRDVRRKSVELRPLSPDPRG